jgi:hypothetical protein
LTNPFRAFAVFTTAVWSSVSCARFQFVVLFKTLTLYFVSRSSTICCDGVQLAGGSPSQGLKFTSAPTESPDPVPTPDGPFAAPHQLLVAFRSVDPKAL